MVNKIQMTQMAVRDAERMMETVSGPGTVDMPAVGHKRIAGSGLSKVGLVRVTVGTDRYSNGGKTAPKNARFRDRRQVRCPTQKGR